MIYFRARESIEKKNLTQTAAKQEKNLMNDEEDRQQE